LLTVVVGNLDMIVRQPENAQRVQRLATSAPVLILGFWDAAVWVGSGGGD
jgi:hypothetical protein